MGVLLRMGSCLARGRLLQALRRPVAAHRASAEVAPKPAWLLRRTLSSTPPSYAGVAQSPLELLWDYYQRNKPTRAPAESRLPEIYERDTQLEDLASDATRAFTAYKRPSDDRSSYVLPVCYGASGSGKTALGKLMLRDLATVVGDTELKALLEQRCQRIFVNFNGGGDQWRATESDTIRDKVGGVIDPTSVHDISLGLRLFARGLLHCTASDLLLQVPPAVLDEMTVDNVMRVTGQALRASRESREDAAVLIHMDEYQMIEPDEARRAMMSVLAGYRLTSFKDRVFVMVLFTGTSMRSAERGLTSGEDSGLTGFNLRYFPLPPLTVDSAMKIVAPALMDWPKALLQSREVRSVIDDLGGLPRLLAELRDISSDTRLADELRGLSFDLDRPAADVARQLAGIVLDGVKTNLRPIAEIENVFTRYPVAMATLTVIALSGLRVKMNTVISRHSTNELGGASAGVWMVEDFDKGGVFSIVPVGDGEVRLHIPQIRLHLLRARIAEWINRAYDYASLFPFPSFDMNPSLFEAAVAAVLAARLNALRSTKGETITVADIFPGCSMTAETRSRSLGALPRQFMPWKESKLGDVRESSSSRRRVLGDKVWIRENVAWNLRETAGSVLRCGPTTKCIDVHFVLPQPVTTDLAHFGIQCKSGASERFNALALYEKAKAYMAPVKDMDHYFVLAALEPGTVERPPMDQWPDGLIVVDSIAEFAPLMRALPPRGVATRGKGAGGGSTKSRRP